MPKLTANGPAIWGGCVTRRSTGQGPGTLARKLSRCKEGMAHFLPSWYKFYEHYACRGTRLIGAANLSPVTKFLAGTGAVSRYNLSRSQKSVKVQDLNWRQMRVSGCNRHYEFVLGAGAKAKSVTNNLPILSVLGLVHFCYSLNHVWIKMLQMSRKTFLYSY